MINNLRVGRTPPLSPRGPHAASAASSPAVPAFPSPTGRVPACAHPALPAPPPGTARRSSSRADAAERTGPRGQVVG